MHSLISFSRCKVNYINNCNYHHIQVLKSFHPPESSLVALVVNHCPTPAPNNDWSAIPIALHFLQCHIDGITQSVDFWVWCPSLSIMWSILLHVSVVTPFSLLSSTPLYSYTTSYVSIHKFVDIWVVSSLEPFWIKLWTGIYKFCAVSGSFEIFCHINFPPVIYKCTLL